MKRFVFFIYIALHSLVVLAQSDSIPFSISRIVIRDNFFTTDKLGVDTSMNAFQLVHSIHTNSISNLFLGNIGLPVRTNILRLSSTVTEPFIFLRPFNHYKLDANDVVIYNANKPFTELQIYTAPKRLEENNIGLLHTRNFGSKWNLTLRGGYIISTGELNNQKAKVSTILTSLSYMGNNYRLILFSTRNKFDIEENGGIVDVYDQNSSQIPVKLDNVYNVVKSNSYGLSQVYYIDWEKSEMSYIADSLVNQRNSYKMISFVHNLTYTQNSRIYSDKDPNGGVTLRERWYYDRFYVDSLNSYDSVSHNVFSTNFGIKINDKAIPFLHTGFALGTEFEKNFIYNFKEVLVLQNNAEYDNLYLNFSAFNENWKYFNWRYRLNSGINGYEKGDISHSLQLNASIGLNKKDTLNLRLTVYKRTKTPSYWESQYYGNRVRWNADLDKINTQGVDFTFSFPKYRQNISAGIRQIDGYVYLGQDITMQQFNNSINAAYIGYNTMLRLGAFRNRFKVEYQKVNTSLLHIPDFAIYNSAFFHFIAIKKVLTMQIGVDAFFTPAFKPLDYNPAALAFYNQTEHEVGGKPIIDVFINGKIRRARLFVKYNNLTSIFTNEKMFYLPNYPIESSKIRFGVSWLFYD